MRQTTLVDSTRKMTTIGYIRVSTDEQDLLQQEHLLLRYAQQHDIRIDEFIRVEISSRKSLQERRITELLSALSQEDTLIVAELSRLGRNMFQTLNLISHLNDLGVKLIFVRQPELSTTGDHAKLLLAIYSYFAEAEQKFISMRTKQGMASARSQGKHVGRPKGSRNKQRILDPYREQIQNYLSLRIPLRRICDLINLLLEKPISYTAYRYFVRQDPELLDLWLHLGVRVRPTPDS
jgi:DNA invertase Pin-like site-specific DNA recombinase